MAPGTRNIIGELKEIRGAYKDSVKLAFVGGYMEDGELPKWKILVRSVLYNCILWSLRCQCIVYFYDQAFGQQDLTLTVGGLIRTSTLCNLHWRAYKFFIDIDTLKEIMFDPSLLHCNFHRPKYALSRLSSVRKYIKKVVKGSAIYLTSFLIIWEVFPILPQIKEVVFEGKKYDDVFAKFDSFLYSGYLPQPWKELLYLVELVTTGYYLSIWISSTVLYYCVIHMLTVQYRILKDSLAESVDSDSEDDCRPMSMGLFVEDHSKLRKISFDLKYYLSSIMGNSLSLSIGIIGFSTYSAVLTPPKTLDSLTYYSRLAIYPTLASGEILMFCWLSDQVTTANDISKAIYSSEWYKSLRYSPKFILPILIAQRKVCLTAWNMVNVSLETFIQVMRLSYSFYTLMAETKD